SGGETARLQPGAVVALIDVDHIGNDILAYDVPRFAAAICAAADAESRTLARCVKHRALVLAQRAAVRPTQFARLRRQVGRQEGAKVALADEADTGGVFFRRDRQTRIVGHSAHLDLV